jgi:protein-S-isoprenylcysteine O-methyltransferase Ste14
MADAKTPIGPLVKTAIFLVLVPGAVLVYVPRIILTQYRELLSVPLGSLRLIGILPIALGVGMLLRCMWAFAVVGRGTPAPIDPPRVLVVEGLYRYVRNPMYVAVGFTLLGEAILFSSINLVIYGLVFWLFAHLFVLIYEERALRRKFGPAYDDYLRRVPRWIPRSPVSEVRS